MGIKNSTTTVVRDKESIPDGPKKKGRSGNERGFNIVELAMVIIIVMITLGEGLPSLQGFLRSYRAAGDAKSISNQLALARMRSAANFTQARLYFSLSSRSYHLETYNKASGQFQIEGGVQQLSGIDSFAYGNLSTPAGTQTVMGQSPACHDAADNTIMNTACILFNSRSVPVDTTGATTSNDAVYLADGSGGYFSVTVAPSGHISAWRYSGSQWVAR